MVVHGKRRGTALGYPTANVMLLHPVAGGVYAARTTIEGIEGQETVHDSVVFVDPSRDILESHLLNFSGDLYDKTITVELLKHLRDSRAYQTDEEIRAAIAQDIRNVQSYFAQV
jgi:riboflavin kinase/FMN adenylyltransferase